jgi:hypothetical protein
MFRPMFREGKELTGEQPIIMITDGAPNFQEAIHKEYFTHRAINTVHLRNITMSGQRNNNKMERMNGEIRDREKTMRESKQRIQRYS